MGITAPGHIAPGQSQKLCSLSFTVKHAEILTLVLKTFLKENLQDTRIEIVKSKLNAVVGSFLIHIPVTEMSSTINGCF